MYYTKYSTLLQEFYRYFVFQLTITIDKIFLFRYYVIGDYMINEIKNIREFYRTLGSNTRLVIRISIITISCTLLAAIYAYTATHSPNYFNLLRISDDLLELTRALAFLGFACTLIVGYAEKKRDNNE